MNIVLLNHYAGSPGHGMEYRPYYMAKYWVRNGHSVTIIGSSFSHLRRNQPVTRWYRIFNEDFIDGIRYIWIRGNSYSDNNIFRFINILTYTFFGMFINRRIDKCDLVITSSTYPLDIFPASKIRSKFPNSVLIFEPHDLWPMTLYEIGNFKRSHPLIHLMQYAEDLSCERSDAIVSMHPQNIDHLETRGCCRNMFYHIPNGVDLETWEGDSTVPIKISELIDTLKNRGSKIVMYTGSVSMANNLRVLIDVAHELRSINIAFVIVGDGPDRHFIEELSTDRAINLFCVGSVDKNCMSSLLKLTDICYVGFKHSPLYKFGMSANKLWDYMMAAKPILMSINSSNDPVDEAKCGITVSSGTAKDIADALRQLLQKTDLELERLGKNGQNFVKENNSYQVLADRFINIAEEIRSNVPEGEKNERESE